MFIPRNNQTDQSLQFVNQTTSSLQKTGIALFIVNFSYFIFVSQQTIYIISNSQDKPKIYALVTVKFIITTIKSDIAKSNLLGFDLTYVLIILSSPATT